VLFTVPDGRVFAANPAACAILGRTQAEICALGRQALSDSSDGRWATLLAERERTGHVHGTARMIRGDAKLIEVEMSTQVFTEADGEQRTCTIIRDVTDRVRMERELVEMSVRLRELTLTDELTGIHNRRGLIAVGSRVLELARRQQLPVMLLFVDIDGMKALNDGYGHRAGDAALRIVARALDELLRSADTVSRIGGDEFVALAVELTGADRGRIEQRLRHYLASEATRSAVGQVVEVSTGWATCLPDETKTVEDLLDEADRAMYRAKSIKAQSAN
jgi:diguanylate cyclase (GGDEF)-like protein/PAS domain S-box-containing protein